MTRGCLNFKWGNITVMEGGRCKAGPNLLLWLQQSTASLKTLCGAVSQQTPSFILFKFCLAYLCYLLMGIRLRPLKRLLYSNYIARLPSSLKQHALSCGECLGVIISLMDDPRNKQLFSLWLLKVGESLIRENFHVSNLSMDQFLIVAASNGC